MKNPATLVLVSYLVASSTWASIQYESAAKSFSSQRSALLAAATRTEKLKVFEKWRTDVNARVSALPTQIPETEIEAVAELYELQGYLKEVSTKEMMGPRCSHQAQVVQTLSNPQGLAPEDSTAVGSMVIEMITNFCSVSK